jgi:hypothetical protein
MVERRLPRKDDPATQGSSNVLLRLDFIHDLVAVRFEENDEFVVERIQVLFRSVELPEMPVKRMH